MSRDTLTSAVGVERREGAFLSSPHTRGVSRWRDGLKCYRGPLLLAVVVRRHFPPTYLVVCLSNSLAHLSLGREAGSSATAGRGMSYGALNFALALEGDDEIWQCAVV